MTRCVRAIPATGAMSRIRSKSSLKSVVLTRVRCADLEQRVAVGRRPHDRFGADIAGAPRPVVDDDGLAETLREPLADQTHEDVTGAAGREPNHYANRPRGIGLRSCNERNGRERGSARCQT